MRILRIHITLLNGISNIDNFKKIAPYVLSIVTTKNQRHIHRILIVNYKIQMSKMLWVWTRLKAHNETNIWHAFLFESRILPISTNRQSALTRDASASCSMSIKLGGITIYLFENLFL